VKFDGQSFAPQLRGEKGTPRELAYVQLNAKWFLRDAKFKMNEAAELYDLSDAPFVEKLIAPDADTEASKAARARLTAVLAEYNPPGGRTDKDAPKAKSGGKKAGAKKAAKQQKEQTQQTP
jgi:arylsulfatase A